jgi:MFS family permease
MKLAYIRLNKEGFLSKKVLRGLEGNALGCAFVEPLWALFGGMIFFYQPLYMKALNLTEVQMGLLNSIAGAIAVVTSFIAGPITDRLGRKKTTLIFDLIGWSLSMLIWAVSQNFWFFLAAVFTNAFSKIPATSWTCLAIEDTPLNKRPVFFGLITIIVTGAGIFTPITGAFINIFGTVPTLRVIYVLAFISMTSMFVIRNRFTEETTIGRELMKHHSKISLKEKWQDYKSAIRYMVSNKLTILIFLIVILTNFQLSFQYFLVIYLKDAIGVTESLTSLIPGISAFVNLIVYLFFIPRMMKKGDAHNLVIGLALCVAGAVSLLLVPYKGFLILLISTIFSAIGNMLMSIFRDTLWNNSIGEEERANIFSAGQAIVNTIAIPSGIIAGVLYQMEWIYPFIVSLAIFTVSFVIALYIKKKLPNP